LSRFHDEFHLLAKIFFKATSESSVGTSMPEPLAPRSAHKRMRPGEVLKAQVALQPRRIQLELAWHRRPQRHNASTAATPGAQGKACASTRSSAGEKNPLTIVATST